MILKAIPLGGVRHALDLAARIGRPVTVSGSLDSSVGLAAGLALAGALPDLGHACGLGTGRLLAADLAARALLPEDGGTRSCAPTPTPTGSLPPRPCSPPTAAPGGRPGSTAALAVLEEGAA